jgi:hypothetical protein
LIGLACNERCSLLLKSFKNANLVSNPPGSIVRTVGMVRARVKIGLANLAYNLRSLVWLNRQAAPA